jgi:hypothetical protein
MGIDNLGGEISISNPDFNGMNLGGELGLVSIANPDVDGANLGGDGVVFIVNPISFFFLVIFDPVSIGEKLPSFII